MTTLPAIPEGTARKENARRFLLKARADESQIFHTRERAVMKLADSLLADEFPAEIVRGLQAIADAIIEARGFEPVFEETVRAARVFVEIKRMQRR